jgi:hypothetical protein
MFEKILLKHGNLNKAKYKIYLKRKRSKIEINYNFAIKLAISILIILIVIFIYLKIKMHKIKKNNNHINKKNIDYKSSYFACFCAMAREENKYANELISYYRILPCGFFKISFQILIIII